MGNNFVPEISSYFQHEDYSLAIRRLLDVCLDINKSALIQNAIDLSKIYHSTVKDKPVASKEFLNAAKAAGIVGIKGHRSVGGFRASMYNALPLESVQALVKVMKEFAMKTA